MAEDIYGTDLSTFAGVGNTVGANPLFTPISGPRVVVEAVARRLMTPRGGLPGFPNIGLDLLAMVGKRMTQVAIERLKAAVKDEAEDDERVLSAAVEFTETGGKFRYRLRVALTLAEGPFALVIGINDVTMELLGFEGLEAA